MSKNLDYCIQILKNWKIDPETFIKELDEDAN